MSSNNINEGNLYNIQTSTAGQKDPSKEGLEAWKNETRRQVMEYLKRSKVMNPQAVLKATFGNILD
jgi:hypothetical protein